MKYVSLFAGIGGFDLALNKLGHECVYVNEWDKYAAQTYEKNFNHKPDTRSIRDVSIDEIPDHELLVGGFPCQSFSIAGKRGGFSDTRGTLFFEVARILQAKKPRLFILENVKGLLSHDQGKTFSTIITALDELGYDIQWQVLNSKNFGVPQNRERVYIVGNLRGTSRPKVFPIIGENVGDSKQITSTTIDANYFKGIDNHGQRTMIGTLRTYKDGNGFREIKSGLAPTIPARAREDGSGQPVIAVPLKFLDRNQKNFQGKYSFTVDTVNTGGIMQDMKVRRLTPVECERLQGFPDNWTAGVSDTQRYKQCGNAVTVNVIYEVASKLSEVI